MKTIFLVIMTLLIVKGESILFDFNSATTKGKWYVVNDDVMGGISKGTIVYNPEGTATFSGKLLPENNGGFASVRAVVKSSPDSQFKGVMLRIKGDGKIYNIRFRTDSNFDGYAYQAKIQTEANVWEEYKVSFDEFEPTFRGRILSGKPALESKNIAQIGLLIADKQFGDFSMEVDWIKFYK